MRLGSLGIQSSFSWRQQHYIHQAYINEKDTGVPVWVSRVCDTDEEAWKELRKVQTHLIQLFQEIRAPGQQEPTSDQQSLLLSKVQEGGAHTDN